MIGKHKINPFTEDQLVDTSDVISAGKAFGVVQTQNKEEMNIRGLHEDDVKALEEELLLE
jgi:hypothetical protein